MNQFAIKPSVYFGEGALRQLSAAPGERFFLVTDPFMIKSGMVKKVTEHLSGKETFLFDKVEPDPSLELVTEGVGALLHFLPDHVVALGGGSAIDEAKAILFFAKKMGKLKDIPLTAIPTTSGTGSEVTSFSVITDRLKGIKYPLVDPSLIPTAAILDVELVKTVPPKVTADTGMDVLTHALEAYVSPRATAFTDALAEKAVMTVFRYLPRSFQNSDDTEAKASLHHASCMAGLAFDQTSLGLCHAIAHNIGGKLKIPHGRANAILLPHVIAFNAQLTDFSQKTFSPAAQRYAYLSTLTGLGSSGTRQGVKNLIRETEKLLRCLQLPTGFQECGITREAYDAAAEAIVKGAMEDACIRTNPRPVSEKNIREILRKAYGSLRDQ